LADGDAVPPEKKKRPTRWRRPGAVKTAGAGARRCRPDEISSVAATIASSSAAAHVLDVYVRFLWRF